jgi:hypothetical protein
MIFLSPATGVVLNTGLWLVGPTMGVRNLKYKCALKVKSRGLCHVYFIQRYTVIRYLWQRFMFYPFDAFWQ